MRSCATLMQSCTELVGFAAHLYSQLAYNIRYMNNGHDIVSTPNLKVGLFPNDNA